MILVSTDMELSVSSHVEEASGDGGSNPDQHLVWPGLLQVHACWGHQGAAQGQPCTLQTLHEHHLRGRNLLEHHRNVPDTSLTHPQYPSGKGQRKHVSCLADCLVLGWILGFPLLVWVSGWTLCVSVSCMCEQSSYWSSPCLCDLAGSTSVPVPLQ